MDFTEFIELHAKCVAAMRDYFVEAEEFEMLGKSETGPLSLRERMRLFCPGNCRERGSYGISG
jgi:hypothetical protein